MLKNNTSAAPTQSFFDTSKRQLFLLVCLSTLVLLFVKKSFIENETAAFEFLEEQSAGSVLYVRSALQYFSIPLIYAWKFIVLAFVIWTGCFTFGYRVTYTQCWKVVMTSELIFIIPELLRIIWFLVVDTDPNIYEIRAFYPFSMMNFFSFEDVPAQWHYPLKSLNIFEVGYWLLAAKGVQHFSRRSYREGFLTILFTYVPIYILWLAFFVVVYK